VIASGSGSLVPGSDSTIAWRNVKISPGAAEDFPVEHGASHYYAARRTGAAPLQSGSHKEKFLFYRGVGRFALPIAATVDADGKVAVRNRSEERRVGKGGRSRWWPAGGRGDD